MKKSHQPLFSKAIFLVASLLTLTALADESPLCNDLAKFSCAPGSYKDGTGEIKSESEVAKFMVGYADKSRIALRTRFAKLLSEPSSAYFKDVAMAGLGLKNSPQCTSSSADDVSACRENLIDGLTTMAQKQSLGRLMPNTGLERKGNLREQEFITENNAYKKVIGELNSQIKKDLNSPETTRKIQDKIFPKVKELIIARLKKASIPEKQLKLMVNKLNSISFEGTDCEEIGGPKGNGEVISSLLIPNAFYHPQANVFKFCSGYLLQSTSEFQIATTIAHELTHSIDPCHIAVGPADLGFRYSSQDIGKMEQEYPLKNVIQCLRDQRSVGARNFSVSEGNNPYCPSCTGNAGVQSGYGMIIPGAGQMAAGMPGGGQMPVQPLPPEALTGSKANFCDNDQIGESFSDWMAYEILPDYMEQNYKLTTDQYRNGYANARRIACKMLIDGGASSRDEHPPIEKRINKLLLVNPKIRTQMGCPAKHPENIYCDSEQPAASSGSAKKDLPTTDARPTRGAQ